MKSPAGMLDHWNPTATWTTQNHCQLHFFSVHNCWKPSPSAYSMRSMTDVWHLCRLLSLLKARTLESGRWNSSLCSNDTSREGRRGLGTACGYRAALERCWVTSQDSKLWKCVLCKFPSRTVRQFISIFQNAEENKSCPKESYNDLDQTIDT